MNSPVSVLVPTYNRAELLPDTLDSILAQTYVPLEVIVVDDGSTDNTKDVVKRFDRKIKYHYVENGGVCRARNIAASLATSPNLAFCDSDDLWRNDKLVLQMSVHERFPDVRCSFTNFSLVSDGEWSQATKFDSASDDIFAQCSLVDAQSLLCRQPLYKQILRFQPIFPSTLVVARSFFDEIGGFTEALGRTLSEDLEFILRCVQHEPTGIVREPVVGIRKHVTNFSADTYLTTLGEIEVLGYALEHHTLDEATRNLLLEEIDRRRVEASYDAFRRGEFRSVVSLLSAVPSSYLDGKARLKLLISKLPAPFAAGLRRVLLR